MLPLDRNACPRTMSVDATVSNLLGLATYLDLAELEAALSRYHQRGTVQSVSASLVPVGFESLRVVRLSNVQFSCVGRTAVTADPCSIDNFQRTGYVDENVALDLVLDHDVAPAIQSATALSIVWPARPDADDPAPLPALSFSYNKCGSVNPADVPVTLSHMAQRGLGTATVQLTLASLWAFVFWLRTDDHLEFYVPRGELDALRELLNVPEKLTSGQPWVKRPLRFVADDLVVALRPDGTNASRCHVDHIVSITASSRALWGKRIGASAVVVG